MTELALVPSIDELDSDLQNKLSELLSHRRARSTLRQYESTWKKWLQWAESKSIQPFPASSRDVVEYLINCSDQGVSKATLAMFMTVMRLSHKGRLDDPTMHLVVQETWSAIKRKDKRPIRKAKTMSLSELMLCCEALSKDPSTKSERDKALLTIGWFGALRASEIVSLMWSDVIFCENGIEITIRHSKTDQEGKGAIIGLPWFGVDFKMICPVRSLSKIKGNLDDKDPSEKIFRHITHKGFGKSLSTKSVTRIIQRSARLADLPDTYSAHSFRRGFATWAASQGVPDRQIMHHGRWRSRQVMDGYVQSGALWRDNLLSALLTDDIDL